MDEKPCNHPLTFKAICWIFFIKCGQLVILVLRPLELRFHQICAHFLCKKHDQIHSQSVSKRWINFAHSVQRHSHTFWPLIMCFNCWWNLIILNNTKLGKIDPKSKITYLAIVSSAALKTFEVGKARFVVTKCNRFDVRTTKFSLFSPKIHICTFGICQLL